MNYPNEPIGDGNPYYRCVSCKKSDPEISNTGHRQGCQYITPAAPVVLKNPHNWPHLTGRNWQDANKILKASLDLFIDLNITGWENVLCNQCGRNADYEHGPEFPDCPVGLAGRLRDSLP